MALCRDREEYEEGAITACLGLRVLVKAKMVRGDEAYGVQRKENKEKKKREEA